MPSACTCIAESLSRRVTACPEISRYLHVRDFTGSQPPGILTGMAKYSPLGGLLQRRSGASVELSFATVAEAVGGLPDSARRHRAWWANDPSHVQARAWLDASWQVDDVRLDQGRVRFRRRRS